MEGEIDGQCVEGQHMALSMNSIVGITGGKTMKMKGTLYGRDVLVLIDCGATHSFLSSPLFSDLKIPLDKRVAFEVQVGDGYHIRGVRVSYDVDLLMQGLRITHTFYPFALGNVDVILGADWLESLDEVLVSWKRSTLKIDMGGQWICLRGDPSLQKTMVSLKSMLKSLKPDEEGFLVEFGELKLTTLTHAAVETDVQQILDDFPAVQNNRQPLPPHRFHDHVIDIHSSASPPNIRPYKYPHSQKTEN